MNVKKVMAIFLSCVVFSSGLSVNTVMGAESEVDIFSIEDTSEKDIEITAEKVSETDSTATIRWDAESSDDVFCYAIKSDSDIIADNIQPYEYTITDLSAANNYSFSVIAKNESGDILGESNTLSVTTDLVIKSATALFKDTIAGDLYINSDYLNLNGYTLQVEGNVYIKTGNINVNAGQLLVDGDLNIQYSSYPYSYLKMTNTSDYVQVNGSFVANSSTSHNGYLTAGTLVVKGDFTQQGSTQSFYATGTHKVILSGTAKQTISFESTQSKFATLEIQNYCDSGVYCLSAISSDSFITNGCNVTFKNGEVSGWTLSGDEIVDGDLYLGGGVLDLAGHKLTIKGNLIQSGGTVSVNGGQLEVTGNYKIQTAAGTNSAGILKMINTADYVKVNGDFVTQSSISHASFLTAGTIEIKGNVTQLSGTYNNFQTSGTHKVILSGDKKQAISFTNTNSNNYSCFNTLEITNTSADGVDFTKSVYVIKSLKSTETPVINGKNLILNSTAVLSDNLWNWDISMYNYKLLNDTEIGGTLYIPYGFDLNGKKLDVIGDVIVSYGSLNIKGGKLFVGEDLSIENSSTYLYMTNTLDAVQVNGNFIANSYTSQNGDLTAGTLVIKGDFIQKGNTYSFYATGTHKVILSGTTKQTISFASTESKFATLEIRNYSDDGIYISSTLNADNVIDNGCNITFKSGERFGWTLSGDEIFDGDLYLGGGVLDLAGHKLTIKGNLIQSGGTVSVNGGELEVTGNYKIQTAAGTNSAGILKMINTSDYVKVNGDFITQSSISHALFLTAGTLEIKGNLTQLSGTYNNFQTSGTHKVILSGAKKQTISFANSNSNYSCFNILEITNTSADGVEFTKSVYVIKELKSTETPVLNGKNLILNSTAVLSDNLWKWDISMYNYKLLNDTEIGGSLYIPYRFDLNGKTLNVGGDTVVSHGTIYINKGKLIIDGNLRLMPQSSSSSVYLRMINESDYVKIEGDFDTNSRENHNGYLTAGILEIKGNFTQAVGYSTNFSATGTHKVILSGTAKQTISFESTQSKFATLEIRNYSDDGIYISSTLNADNVIDNGCNITFKSGERFGWMLSGDETFDGDLYLGVGVLDLDGHKLTIKGNLIQSGGTVNVNGGQLEVTGNYKIQTAAGTNSAGILKMLNTSDYVKVGGDFLTQSSISHASFLTAGTLEIKGNVTQLSGSSNNFQTSGTHKVILSGAKKQTISFAYSNLNILEITNTSADGVDFTKQVYVNKELKSTETPVINGQNLVIPSSSVLSDNLWNWDISMYNYKLLNDTEIGGTLYISGSFDLNGKTLTVKGSLLLHSGALTLNGGKLFVDEDLNIVSNSTYLNMTNISDAVQVNGNFIANSEKSQNGYLTAGTLVIKGDFIQKGNTYSFYATGTHKVILSGTAKQTISFANTESKFATLEIQNYSDDGIYISSTLNADNVIDNGCNITFKSGERFGWMLSGDETFDGDLYLGGGVLDLAGHKLTIKGNLIQSGGTVNVNGGELEVTGNYKIQTAVGTNSAGILKMINTADYVKVNGDFITQSSISHASFLTAGTIEIKGNLTQLSGNYDNFKTSGTHKVILSGAKKQTISFANTGTSWSCFNILEITNSSTAGVDFTKSVYVIKELKSTGTPIKGGKNIIITSPDILIDNLWKYDITFSNAFILKNDLEIGGSLYINNNADLSGKTLTVKGNLLLHSGTLTLNGGKLFIGKDFRIQSVNTASDGTDIYSYGYGLLKMVNTDDYIRVDGDFYTYSLYTHTNCLTAGTLEIRGNMTQRPYSSSDNNFFASGTHKVILSGTKKQNIDFQSESSKLNILETTKPIDSGYTFSRTPLWNQLIERPADSVPPIAPSNIRCVNKTPTSIVLEWNEGSDNYCVDGYYVYRDGVLVGTSSSAKFIDTNLKSNTTYVYYLIAFDLEKNVSPKSNAIEAYTLADLNAPTVPKGLKTSVIDNLLCLSWTSSTDNVKVEGYNVYRDGTLIANVNGTSFVETAELAGGLYTYTVKAVDNAGNLSDSSLAVSYDNMPPSAPVIQITTITDKSIQISWSSYDNVSITLYNLYRNGEKIRQSTASSYTENNIQAGSLYDYYVEAIDSSGNISEASNVVSIQNENDVTAPEILSISPSGKTTSKDIPLKITVTDNASVASVVIQYSIDKEKWFDYSTVNATGKTSETLSGILRIADFNDGKVYIRAVACDASGNTSQIKTTPVVEYLIDKTSTGVPKNVVANISSGRINVSWEVPEEDDVSYFNVYRSVNNENSYVRVVSDYRYINYIDQNMEIGKTYYYKISAVDHAGNESEKSIAVSEGLISDNISPSLLSISPDNGVTLHNNSIFSIACMDNYKLKSIAVECTSSDTEAWTEMFYSNLNVYSSVVNFQIDSDGMSTGDYQFKVILTDTSGNKMQYTTEKYHFEVGNLSVPVLAATPGGWSVNLSWTQNESNDISHYSIYRKSSASAEYECIASTIKISYLDEVLTPDKTYYYYVKAVDIYGNTTSSDFVVATPTNEDYYAPTAYAGEDFVAIKGKEINFNGSQSYDNFAVASYNWNFGDGSTSTSAKPKHTYASEGTYKVTLTVKDGYGNQDTDIISVEVLSADYNEVNMTVTDLSGRPLSDAMVYCETFAGTIDKMGTNTSGKAQLILGQGNHTIYIYKEGYLPVSKAITIDGNEQTVIAQLEKKELVTGVLEVKALDLNEMIALGIDINAPENQYVFKYTFNIKYLDEENWVICQNKSGEIIRGETTFRKDGKIITLEPYVCGNVPFVAIVEVDTEISWLKEFFEVNLTVVNNASEEFSIVKSSAKLNIPSGLSLAKTNRDEKLWQDMGSIYGGQQKTVSWIVRGDKSGEYNISADFKGTLMPFGLDVNTTFKSGEPLKVYGGNALKFDVVHDVWGVTGEYWDVTFTLTNTSDINLYNVSANISGFAEFMEVTDMQLVYPDGTVLVIPWVNGKPDENNAEIYIPALFKKDEYSFMTLKPGESIHGVYSIKPQV